MSKSEKFYIFIQGLHILFLSKHHLFTLQLLCDQDILAVSNKDGNVP